MADADCKLGTFRAITDRHAVVAWRPWLDGDPRLQFAVVQRYLAI